MADKKERRSALTPPSQVDRIMGRAADRQRRESTDGRGQAGHAGTKGIDKRGQSKKTLMLPLETQARIEHLARAEGVTQADIVAVAVAMLDELRQAGRVDLEPLKALVYSEAQPWRSATRIAIPEDFIFFDD